MSTTVDEKLSLLFARRSIRVYSPGEISDEAVTKMLEAAMAAPSAMGKDPWRFIIVRDATSLARMPSILPGGGMLSTAAAAIAVCGDLDVAHDRQISYLLQDCSACIENLLLCAHALGIGACWVGVHPSEDSIRGLKQLLGLPGSIIPVAVIALGHRGEELEPRTRYNNSYIHCEKW